MSFGEKIKNIRKERNLTQEELGKELYVTRAAVSKWERDLCLPSEDILERICELYNISIDELLEKKDILRNSNNIKKTSRKILISSIIGGSILLCVIICLLVAIFMIKDKNDVYDEYYASFVGLDKDYLYAETKNGPVSIPKEMILSIKENDEEVKYEEMRLHDYGLVERQNNQFRITITDHKIAGLIASKDACGFLLSFQDDLCVFDSNQIGIPFYYNGSLCEEYFSGYGTNLNSRIEDHTLSIDFSYDSNNLLTKRGYVNLYEIVCKENKLTLRFYRKVSLNSSFSFSFTVLNEKFSRSKIYDFALTVNLSFTKVNKEPSVLYQYDVNMNLLGSVSLDNNYLDDFIAKESIIKDAFLNLLYCGGNGEIINSNSVEQAYTYDRFIPYKSGFYSWF